MRVMCGGSLGGGGVRGRWSVVQSLAGTLCFGPSLRPDAEPAAVLIPRVPSRRGRSGGRRRKIRDPGRCGRRPSFLSLRGRTLAS